MSNDTTAAYLKTRHMMIILALALRYHNAAAQQNAAVALTERYRAIMETPDAEALAAMESDERAAGEATQVLYRALCEACSVALGCTGQHIWLGWQHGEHVRVEWLEWLSWADVRVSSD